MENILGLLRVRVRRGINLAIRDSRTSDPYVVLQLGQQKLKTSVIKNSCNPEWNEEVTFSISESDLESPITLEVYDEDTLTFDDKMGDAAIDLKPYIECLKMGSENLEDGCVVKMVHPNRENCLSEESVCVSKDGKIVQDMCLRLRNVERGEIVVQIEWIDLPGCKGLSGVAASSSCLGSVEATNGLLGVEATN